MKKAASTAETQTQFFVCVQQHPLIFRVSNMHSSELIRVFTIVKIERRVCTTHKPVPIVGSIFHSVARFAKKGNVSIMPARHMNVHFIFSDMPSDGREKKLRYYKKGHPTSSGHLCVEHLCLSVFVTFVVVSLVLTFGFQSVHGEKAIRGWRCFWNEIENENLNINE